MTGLLDRISIDPNVCFGKPRIKGTRIWVSLILDFLASGMSEQEILEEYPQLTHEDILAALAYGAEVARERIIQFLRTKTLFLRVSQSERAVLTLKHARRYRNVSS